MTDFQEIITALELQGELNAEHLGFDFARVIAAMGNARLITQDPETLELISWRLVHCPNNKEDGR